MEATAVGPNRTGAAIASKDVEAMLDAVNEFSPPAPISTLQMDVERQSYITNADRVGSIPPPTTSAKTKGKKKAAAVAEVTGVFLDKVGERIAFERTGTRLYDALITKYLALTNAQGAAMESESTGNGADETSAALLTGETGLRTLQKIRADELSHFLLLSECMRTLGGDPTAQTPCADVTATASMGLMQVVTDPRTTLAQSLGAILTAELTDNAGWELLSELAVQAGQQEMAERFGEALEAEAEHLEIVRGWLQSLLTNDLGTPAV
jgi:hypothetical protein